MLTPEEIQSIRSKVGLDKMQSSSATQSATPITDRLRAAQKKKEVIPSQITQTQTKPVDSGYLSKLMNAVQSGVDWVGRQADKTYIPQAIGSLIGGAGEVLGGAVGAIGTPIANTIKGRPTWENLKSNVARTASETGKFGYDIGKTGTEVAPLGALGRIPNAVMAATQGYSGGKEAYQGIQENDPTKIFEGASNLALGALGARGAVKGKGNFIDKDVTQGFKTLGKQAAETRPVKAIVEPIQQFKTNRDLQKAEVGYKKATDVNAPRAIEFKEKTGIDPHKFLLEEQLPLNESGKGNGVKIDTFEARQIIDKERIPELGRMQKEVLKTRPQADFFVEDIVKKAQDQIDSPAYKSKFTSLERQKIKKAIAETVEADAQEYGTRAFNATQAGEIKTSYASKAYEHNKPMKMAKQKAISDVLRSEIDSKFVGHEGERVINDLNKKMSHYYEAKKLLAPKGGLHGKPIRGGVLGKKINQVIGAGIGTSAGGPVGGIVVAHAAGSITDFVKNPRRLTQNALELLKKNGEMPEYITTLEEARKYLYQQMLQGPKQIQIPERAQSAEGRAMITPAPRVPTTFEPKSKFVGKMDSEMNSSVQKKMLDSKALEDYHNELLKDVRKDSSLEFPDYQMENQYTKFVELLKDKKTAFKKESIQNGDVESLYNSLKNIMSKSEIDKILYSQDMSADEVLNAFRDRVMKENPEILTGKRVSENLGYKKEIPPASELFGSDSKVFDKYKRMGEKELFAAIGGIEVTTDKDGKKHIKFNSKKAALSMLLMAGVNRIKPETLAKIVKTPEYLAQRDVVASKLNEALPKIQEKVGNGKITMDQWSELTDLQKKIEKGKDSFKDIQDTAELLKLTGHDPFKFNPSK